MICKNCGATINDSAKFCEQCGVVIIRDAENNVQNQNFSFAIELDVKEAPVQHAEAAVQTKDTQISAEPKNVEAVQQAEVAARKNKSKRIFEDKFALAGAVMFGVAMVMSIIRCASIRYYIPLYLIIDSEVYSNEIIGLALICASCLLMIIHTIKEYKTDKKYYCLMSAMLIFTIGCYVLSDNHLLGPFIVGPFIGGIASEFIIIAIVSLVVLYGSVKRYKHISIPIIVLLVQTLHTFVWTNYLSSLELMYALLSASIGLLLITIRGLKKEEALTD